MYLISISAYIPQNLLPYSFIQIISYTLLLLSIVYLTEILIIFVYFYAFDKSKIIKPFTMVHISIDYAFSFILFPLSLIFYLAAYLAFSLYSISPFRFKNRGVLGVIADASGAHLFPSLFVASSMMHNMHISIDPYWLVIVGVWSFAYGLRGILWHQFWDRENASN